MDAHKSSWTGDGTCPKNLAALLTSIFSHSGFRGKKTWKGKSFPALTR